MNISYEEHPFPSFYNRETEYLIVGGKMLDKTKDCAIMEE